MDWKTFYEDMARRVRNAIVAATFPLLAAANVGASYNMLVQTLDADTGAVLHQQVIHNLVTTAGLNLLKAAIATGSCAVPQYFAFGTSGTAVTAGDTALGAEIAASRQINTGSTQDATQPTLTLQYYLSSTQCNGNTIREVGLFTATPSGGTMYARVVLATPIVKTTSVAVAFTWTLTWGAV